MKRIIVIVVLLALFVPGVLVAQGELTLEGLAEQVENLAKQVSGIDRDIRLLSQLYMPDAVRSDEGACMLASQGAMHPSTVAAYMALSDGQVPSYIQVISIWHNPGGETAITIHPRGGGPDAYVIEYWQGCEFQTHSRFWDEDFSGNITYLD